jgi:cytochrome bd-type quinol oxidase subunit 2
VALPPAAVMGARLLHILTHGPMRTAALALAQLLATTLLVPLVVAVACWWLGFRYARRTGARGPWGRLRAAGHFSSRAVAVPALAIQAILLTLALLCAGPLAWHRHQMAFAIGESWVDQSRAIADALASQPTATTIGR